MGDSSIKFVDDVHKSYFCECAHGLSENEILIVLPRDDNENKMKEWKSREDLRGGSFNFFLFRVSELSI